MAKYIYFESADEIFRKFDNYEIWPCVLVGQTNFGNDYESCNTDDPDIAIWCVYGHLQSSGIECISDHESYDDAKEYMKTLPTMPLSPLTPF
jgi:hypothetical protein